MLYYRIPSCREKMSSAQVRALDGKDDAHFPSKQLAKQHYTGRGGPARLSTHSRGQRLSSQDLFNHVSNIAGQMCKDMF